MTHILHHSPTSFGQDALEAFQDDMQLRASLAVADLSCQGGAPDKDSPALTADALVCLSALKRVRADLMPGQTTLLEKLETAMSRAPEGVPAQVAALPWLASWHDHVKREGYITEGLLDEMDEARLALIEMSERGWPTGDLPERLGEVEHYVLREGLGIEAKLHMHKLGLSCNVQNLDERSAFLTEYLTRVKAETSHLRGMVDLYVALAAKKEK